MDVKLRMTVSQFKEINRRARLGVFDGKARSEYIVGCALGEEHDELLERVRTNRDAERAKFRAELEAERAERERASEGPAATAGPREPHLADAG